MHALDHLLVRPDMAAALGWIFAKLRQSDFARAVSILAVGSGLAQVIAFIASLVLARLFSPLDFGLFAVFMASISALAPAVCGRYEIASILPRRHAEGRQLLAICLRIALGIALLLLITVAAARDSLLEMLKAPALGAWILLMPVSLFLIGISTAFEYYANRLQHYSLISRLNVIQVTLASAFGIALGLAGAGFEGLLISSILGLATMACFYSYLYRRVITTSVLAWNTQKTVLLRRYRDFPIYGAPTSLLNSIAYALPIFFLSRYFSPEIVGLYALMTRVVGAPISLVSSSVSQVHLKKIASLLNEKRSLTPYIRKVTITLLAISIPPALVLATAAPELFAWIFGERWRQAGQFAQILTPALVIRFVVATISGTLGATHNNRLSALWMSVQAAVTVTVLALLAPNLGIKELLIAITLMDIFLYLLFYLAIWNAAARPKSFI